MTVKVGQQACPVAMFERPAESRAGGVPQLGSAGLPHHRL